MALDMFEKLFDPYKTVSMVIEQIWKIHLHIVNGFGLYRNANYIVNIIEELYGSGRDDNGIPIPGVRVERQKKETKWMLTLQTVYPYGLNDRVGDEYMVEKGSCWQ